jgi:hypothetical protein
MFNQTNVYNSSCAFPNTPKYAQVEQSGKGLIVNKQWILDCHKKNQLLPEKSYKVKQPNKRKSKGEDEPTEKKKTPVKKKSTNTNEDQSIQFDELPDFFHGIHFYVSYGDYDDNTLLDIIRVILAYDGIIEKQINSDVKYIITNRLWNLDFDKVCKKNHLIITNL